MPDPSTDLQIDAARLPVMLSTLRLPSIARHWQTFATRADREGWGAARYLATLCEHELTDRTSRRIARHLAAAGLPRGKTFATFDFGAVPTIRKAQLLSLGAGDPWIERGGNILCFGPSGTGKTHAAAAIGHALFEGGRRVLFSRTTDLVQKLQAAHRDLSLPALLSRLDRFDCLILDDLGYARKDQAETAVLFELIAERYERRSLIVTCNQPFSEWNAIFPDPVVATAILDRLLHHSTVITIRGDSYRLREKRRSNVLQKAGPALASNEATAP